MSDVEDVLSHAPVDAKEAVGRILHSGGVATSVTPMHGMAFALLEFALGDIEVRVVSDRGQWAVDVRRPGEEWLQFDLIYAITSGDETHWSKGLKTPEFEVQLPPNVSWRAHLPAAIEWVRSTSDAASQVADAAVRRSNKTW